MALRRCSKKSHFFLTIISQASKETPQWLSTAVKCASSVSRKKSQICAIKVKSLIFFHFTFIDFHWDNFRASIIRFSKYYCGVDRVDTQRVRRRRWWLLVCGWRLQFALILDTHPSSFEINFSFYFDEISLFPCVIRFMVCFVIKWPPLGGIRIISILTVLMICFHQYTLRETTLPRKSIFSEHFRSDWIIDDVVCVMLFV